MNNRTKLLSKIEKQAKLDKAAIKVAQDSNLVETENPQEYAERIFDALLNNIEIEGLED